MPSSISLVLIETNAKARDDLVNTLKTCEGNVGIVAAADDLHVGMKSLQAGNPQIVILEVKEVAQGVKETAFIVSRFPQTTVIVTAAEKNPDWILRLIRAGAGEYLTKPIVATELVDAVNKVTKLHAQKNVQNNEKGSVIAVYNPSAGMGTTTIAVNLAATLASRGENVALIDLNLFCGDIAAFLDLAPRYTLANVTAKMGQIDASFLRSVIVPHSSGVHVLNGPVDLGDADRIMPELLQEVIAILQASFAYTIIDTGGQLSGCNLATFDCSDRILFTTVLNLPALKNAKRYLAAMDYKGFGADKVKLVINRHIPKDDIKIADAEKVLNAKAYLTVPNAYSDAKTSINKGEPLISCYPRSPVTKAMDELTRQLVLETTTKGKPALQGGYLT